MVFNIYTDLLTIRKPLSDSTSHFPFNKAQSSPYGTQIIAGVGFGATTSFQGTMAETKTFKLLCEFPNSKYPDI